MTTNHLTPTVCSNETEVAEVAFDGVRRRPVLAINEEGELTVCCRRTARKHGWEIKGALFQRSRTGRKAATKAAQVAADKKSKPAKLAIDLKTGVIVRKSERRATDKPVRVAGAVTLSPAVTEKLVAELLK